jgi:hypothetical protein
MPTGPKGEKRPADVLGKRRFKPFHEGRFNEVRPERAKTQPPALTSEGDRDRLLPGLLAVDRSNIASYT